MDKIFKIKDDKITIVPGTKIVRAEQLESLLDSQAIIDQSKVIANEIKEKAEVVYKERYDEGYENGYNEGKDEYTSKIMDMLMSQVDSLNKLELDLANVVIDSVKKIINEIPDNELVIKIVRQGINTVRGQKRVVVRISPADEGIVREDLKLMLISNDGSSGYLEIHVDSSLHHGDCILETPLGIVNSSLDNQLRILKNAVIKCVQQQEL